MNNFLLLSAIYLFAPQLAAAEDDEELRCNLMEKMPEVTIGEIRKLPYVDIYEIQCNGVNAFYTDAKGDVALFGKLMELQTRPHLSDLCEQELMVVQIFQLPPDKAFVKLKRSGERKLTVYSDASSLSD